MIKFEVNALILLPAELSSFYRWGIWRKCNILMHFGSDIEKLSIIFNTNVTSVYQSSLMQENDNITETRNSTEKNPSFWVNFKAYLCPCLLVADKDAGAMSSKQPNTVPSVNSKTSETNNSNGHYVHKQTFDVMESRTPNRNTKRKNSMQYQQNEKKEVLLSRNTIMFDRDFRETVNIQLGYNYRMCSIDEFDCPISNLNENVLLSIGLKNRQLLVKVSRANISIKLALLKREIANKKKKTEKIEQKKYGEFEFHKYWNQRYILFEKFDEGIKIDENSWTINPPEQVSEYIANKCNGAKIILDAFAGVGGTSIKLANINSCAKVIANEQNNKKMGFLLNNAKVYQVDHNIELSENDFLHINRGNIDVVVLQPNLADFTFTGHKDISISDFYPSLDKILMKALKMAPNTIILLPPETNIDSLCSCIHKCASETKRMKDFCSIKIEKIYCQMQIKYILVCIGTLVQTEVKLNDELEYIYSQLKKPGEVYFKHKKVLKKLREDYGMLDLFNLVKQSDRRRRQLMSSSSQGKELLSIEVLYDLVREKGLIPADKLSKLLIEQDAEYERQSSYFQSITFDQNEGMSPIMEEEKYDENPFNIREAELTQSEYSHYSYLSSFDKKSGNNKSHRSSAGVMREQGEKSNPSIIINRMNRGSRQKSDSPLTPNRKGKGQIAQLDLTNEIQKKNE